jgi:hypothetical protein
VLDHSGKKTNRMLSAENGWINIDGAQTKAIYYLIEY